MEHSVVVFVIYQGTISHSFTEERIMNQENFDQEEQEPGWFEPVRRIVLVLLPALLLIVLGSLLGGSSSNDYE